MSFGNGNAGSVKIPLLYALLVPFVVLTIGIAGSVGFISYRSGKQSVNDVAARLRGEIASRIEGHLRTFLETPHRLDRLNANLMRRGLLKPDDPETLMRHFWDQVGNNETITSVYFGNTRGGLANSGREGAAGFRYFLVTDGFAKGPLKKYGADAQGGRGDLLVTIPSFDATLRQWYTAAIEKGDDAWSPVYILSTGQDMAIAASRPVYDDRHQLLGVVSVDLFLSHIGFFLKQIRIGETGRAFIIERSGQMIAASTGERLFKEQPDRKTQVRVNAAESETPLIRYSMEALMKRPGGIEGITGGENLEFLIDGERQYLHVAPMRLESGLDWLILVVIPEADFMAPIRANNRAAAWLMAAALVVMLVVGFLAARAITRPVKRLNEAARSLAKGDWTQAVPVESSVRELSNLTLSFNRMADQLQRAMDELKKENIERRQAEEILRATSGRLQGIMENSPLLISEMGIDGRYVLVNMALSRLFGKNPWDLSGQPLRDLLPEETADLFLSRIDRVRITGAPLTVDDRLEIGGRERRYSTVLFPLFNADRQVVSVGGIAQDVTERMKALDSLRESEERLKLALEGADLGLWDWWPRTGRVVFNARWGEMLGYELGELEPHVRSWENLIHPDDRAEVEAILQKHLRGETVRYEVEHRLAHKAGGWVWVLDRGKVIERTPEGEPLRACGTHLDITERKRAEEEKDRLQTRLNQARKMESVGTLAGGVAHDFNNLLQIIIGNAQILLLDLDEASLGYKGLLAITDAADRAAHLVRQLLLFSRKMGPDRKPLDLNREVERVLNVLRDRLPANVELRFQPGQGLWAVQADPAQLEQVVLNLGGNAVDALPVGGTITVSTQNLILENPDQAGVVAPAGDYLLLTIADNGEGIEARTLEHIFEPFFTTREFGQGAGLGLASAYGIVKGHHGAIHCDSEVGRGTVFRVYLPAAGHWEPDPASGLGWKN